MRTPCCARALQAVRLTGKKPLAIRNVGSLIVIPWFVKRFPPVCNVRWRAPVDRRPRDAGGARARGGQSFARRLARFRRCQIFLNGACRGLEQVLAFYNLRSVQPGKVYPHDANGKVEVYNDLPNACWGNVDTTDAPFNRKVGDPPALTQRDIHDIIAFLHTLDDGCATSQVRRTTAVAGR